MNAPLPRQPVREGRLFQGLRLRLARNSWETLFGQGSLRPLTIVLCSIVVWLFVFGVSMAGFKVLRELVQMPLGSGPVGRILDVLFLTLGLLLIFSCGLILYGSLFTAPEAAFLLSKPVRDDQVFAYKFQGAVAFSSWAFLLLGGPILIAYGLVADSPWYFYALLPVFFLGFVLVPGSLGGLICLLVVNFVPRRRKQVLALLILVLLLVAGVWLYQVVRSSREEDSWDREAFHRLLTRFAFAGTDLVPSHWVSRGLQAAGRGNAGQASWYLALVWSNGLFLYLLTALTAKSLYRRGYNRLATGGTLRRRYGGAWMDRLLAACLPAVHPSTRQLIVKDFRTFRRDPQQWAQILIFSGLMTLYFTNVRRFFVTDIEWVYQNTISLLNLCAVALLLCTYTGRFVYPLLSLEGRKFWILGLLPLQRDQLLWGKFAFATAGAVLISEGLVLLSDVMLEMPWDAMVLHVLIVLVLSAGLSGLSVGLGAWMPNFRETDPSKIAVGFGGTLNLVAGLFFLLLTVVVMALPWHVQMALPGAAETGLRSRLAVVAGVVGGLGVGAAAVLVPLNLGIKALRRMEF
jgi:ABC-2 type transport system permease protein